MRSSLAMCPGEQEVQDVAPSFSVIMFFGHLVQLLIVLSRYVPAGHRAVSPEEEVLKLLF